MEVYKCQHGNGVIKVLGWGSGPDSINNKLCHPYFS